jgi:hypothetical protein
MMKFKIPSLVDKDIRDPWGEAEGSGIGLNIIEDSESFKQTLRNLEIVPKVISYTMARAVGYVGVHLLTNAQPRVPYATGELRRSGRVDMLLGWSKGTGYALTLAKGLETGEVESSLSKITRKRIERGKRAVTNIEAYVHYHREGELNGKPIDVALWTHEVIHPHEERSHGVTGEYYATYPRTGPKYLELPFLQYKNEYIKILRNAAENDSLKNLKKITKVIRKKGSEVIKLVENRIDTLGYYASIYDLKI